jgi:hypothetical protein
MTISNSKINNSLLIFLIVLFVLISILIVLSLDRGFNFIDEGFYLLQFKYTGIYKLGVRNYDIIITKLTNWYNAGILTYRWMSFVLTILSSIILSFGLYKWIKTNIQADNFFKNFIFIFCFISIGNFSYYFIGIQTISYNTLTNFFLQAATGLMLYLFSVNSARLFESRINIIILGIIGFICAFNFFNKYPSAILQIISYFIIIFLYIRKQSFKYKFFILFSLCSGCLIGILIYFTLFQPYSEWSSNFKNLSIIVPNYSPVTIANKYFYEILSMILFSLHYFSWLLIFPVYIIYSSYATDTNHIIMKYLKIAVICSVLFFIYEILHFKIYRSPFITNYINANIYLIIITFQIILFFAILFKHKILSLTYLNINFNKILILLLLFITPFFGSFGTMNRIFLNVLFHIAPWFGAILILLIVLSKHIKNPIILSLFIIVPALITTSQIVDGNIFIPYYSVFFENENHSNFFKQTEAINDMPVLKGIYVDTKTKRFLEDLNHLLKKNNYREGYPIFGLKNLQGVIYVLGGIIPGSPWFDNKPSECYAWELYKLNNNPPVILQTDLNLISSELLNCMRNNGINFPYDYKFVGEVYFPNEATMLKVYFPKVLS